MIDLHTHSLFSDGEFIPSELVRRFEVLGYSAVAITDHADSSMLDLVIPLIVQAANDLNETQSVKVIPGIELTHIPPTLISACTRKARELGAKLIVVHGESIAEPVPPGTNRAALDSGVDILAHPGLIAREDALKAAQNGIFLEISSRKGHCLTNGHVARLACEVGAKLLLDSDTHSQEDIMTEVHARGVVEGAGLPPSEYSALMSNARLLLDRIGYPL